MTKDLEGKIVSTLQELQLRMIIDINKINSLNVYLSNDKRDDKNEI